MTGYDTMARPGSRDAPLLCSAGVLARLQGSLGLDTQGLGWSDASFQQKASIPGSYPEAQGLALFGRQVYVGLGLGVVSFRIEIEELP